MCVKIIIPLNRFEVLSDRRPPICTLIQPYNPLNERTGREKFSIEVIGGDREQLRTELPIDARNCVLVLLRASLTVWQ